LFSKQIDIKLQREYLPESDPRIVRLKNEIEFMRKAVDDLKKGSTEFSNDAFAAGELPDLITEYVGLSRDAQIQTAILTLLAQQLETAKLEAMGTNQSFQIIEKAEIPEVRFKPGRSKIAVVACITAFFASMIAAFIVEFIQKAKQDPVEGEKLLAIKRMLTFGKKAHRG
jgi:tyrosine-protein kinase Etk/Wzc